MPEKKNSKNKKTVKNDTTDKKETSEETGTAVKKELPKKSSSSGIPDKLKRFFPLSFIIAFVFDLIYGLFYYNSFEATALFDTSSYFEAAGRLAEGKVDLLRTPLYPVYLRFCEKIGGENVNQVAVSFQIIFFFISIWFFYKLLEQFTSNHVMLAAGSILYGCMTPYINFNFMMLTESFSVSLIVIFCFFLVRSVKEYKFSFLTVSIILSFIMTMLRPGAVYLYIADLLAMIPFAVKFIRKKLSFTKAVLVPLISFILCVAALFGYMSKNKSDNGYYGLSYVSEMNKFYDVVMADIWQDNQDREIVDKISELTDGGPGTLGAAIDTETEFRDPARIKAFNAEAIDDHTKDYCLFLLKKVWTMGYNHMSYNLSHDSYYLKEDVSRDIYWIGDFLDFNVNFVYLIVLMSGIFIVALIFDRKRFLWPEFLITAVRAGQLAVNILAGPAEFHRLNATCYPLAILLLFAWAGLAYDKIRGSGKAKEEDSSEDKG